MASPDPVAEAVAALPPLRTTLDALGLQARKALGQHFLLDLNLTARIARLGGDLAGVDVVEVGPGPGGLTRALVAAGPRRVLAVERDPRFVAALAPLVAAAAGRLTLVEADALAFDAVAATAAPRMVIANLPYNVGTPLLVGWLLDVAPDGAPRWQRLAVMLQREVADRIVAPVGGDAYGRLSVLAQWRARVRIGLKVPAASFVPPPKVESAVVVLEPRPLAADDPPVRAMERVLAAAFGQRRKMLRRALAGLGDGAALAEAAGLDPQARAETVDVAGFKRLARIVAGQAA